MKMIISLQEKYCVDCNFAVRDCFNNLRDCLNSLIAWDWLSIAFLLFMLFLPLLFSRRCFSRVPFCYEHTVFWSVFIIVMPISCCCALFHRHILIYFCWFHYFFWSVYPIVLRESCYQAICLRHISVLVFFCKHVAFRLVWDCCGMAIWSHDFAIPQQSPPA